ncbi:hypothetical protein [Marinisporobacter balticus]|uniref:Uncharacterized protein n=1 Tax=Marinisporobacter balticus TaxID=2018667 RepID=A0A4R2KHS2_9FIRM|nr:hypothetical protein [Marinisporobacter balticus]TCO69548.1 hypothetical protein EV214_13172 [Marinisporobacter balticus]
MDAFIGMIGVLGFLVCLVVLIYRFIKKKPKKPIVIGLGLSLCLFILGVSMDSSPSKTDAAIANEKPENKQVEEVKKESKEESLKEFKATMSLKVEEKNVIATIETNAPNGTLLETSLMNADMNNFKSLSEFIEVKDGKATHTFNVSDWPTGYIGGIASMRFDLKDHPQPPNILEFYGEKGEKAEGIQIEDAHDDFKYGKLENITIAYPSEAAVKEKLDKLFIDTLNEMISKSEGVIIDIKPATINDWSIVYVTVSDSWYYSPKHEQERFAEQIANTVQTVLYNCEKVKKDSAVSVYYYDTYKKKLASPKMFGGYEIEE